MDYSLLRTGVSVKNLSINMIPDCTIKMISVILLLPAGSNPHKSESNKVDISAIANVSTAIINVLLPFMIFLLSILLHQMMGRSLLRPQNRGDLSLLL